MRGSSRCWSTRAPARELVLALARRTGLSEVGSSVLASRGHGDAESAAAHLEASPRGLHDPGALPGMREACARLARAIQGGETILVHGDYDVDGVTGTVLLMRCLTLLGGRAQWHIPNRLVDGYSFGPHSVARAKETGARVVISVDNGTAAFETIAELAAIGVDTVVTDHHEPPLPHPKFGALPAATAIVNPKLAGSTYPWRELCGGAVAFKLAWGLCQELSGAARVRAELKRFLDDALAYVAIATICDVVPLLDENRIFARAGLRALGATQSPGLRALLDLAGLSGRQLAADDVAFGIGPRINAAGRLGAAEKAVELLLATDPVRARSLAAALEEHNRERKRIESEVLREAREAARAFEDRELHPVLVLAGPWHQGVVGIVAARLVEEFSRPALVIGLEGDFGRGSARSVDGFDVLGAMHGAAPHFRRYGGHAQAAGCEIDAGSVAAAREAMCGHVRASPARPGGAASLAIDCEVPLAAVTVELMRELERLAPWGPGNEAPVFAARDLRLAEPARTMGADGAHLSLVARSGASALRAVGFGMGHRVRELQLGRPLSLAFTPRWNTFRGETRLELELQDFRADTAVTVGSPQPASRATVG